MSGSGQKRKSGDANPTSAPPLKADLKRTSREVRKVPKAEVRSLERHVRSTPDSVAKVVLPKVSKF
jgi:hypothetical protein